ncbi:MAG: flagellar M-ring protein FliF [gamma proteobacterium endosymbiont of Lamellibrachia anaximandri]|nr:flagellar M-ring protein FliF [gamma proteobacterium endosymbiont of Lamellibrachia anaximandri]MBL3534181.1 flagellar M-ring protein FliF [gamma proteobacterium endosymbiont of Lamellibrachia anaximandri]MBL3599385.1 flagellar M-ring protein FliF [gamma proteobacterium endosymbiont of Lamellibrachia anaximandri]
MALATTDESGKALEVNQRLQDNPIFRQIAVMVGIAASVALGVAVVLWSQAPNYSLLYGNLAQKDAMEIVQALQQIGIEYQVDQSSGAVMVPSADLQEARMKLAGQGLPHSDSLGFELLQQDAGFNTSRMVEAARYQRAMEGELARSIATLANIETARVHLATPKQSVFVRQRKVPSASVVIKLYSGRTLEKGQVEAISHLVASSVPELDVAQVTVVDHKGKLLSGAGKSAQMTMSTSQFEYTRELEAHYKQRIEDILSPLLGQDNLRAEVAAEVDFTVIEQTQESYDPDMSALRSEQINEQQSRLSEIQGVPGALTNQPPAAGNAPEQAGGEGGEGEAASPINTSKRATRNFELDKTISHTRLPSNSLRRLSVAVVVNDRVALGEDGVPQRIQRTPEEITRITNLVKETVGFKIQRGDSVQVLNESFFIPAPPEPLPELAIWEEAWFWDAVRQAGGVLLVLLLIFGVLKPTMNRLTAQVVTTGVEGEGVAGGGVAGEGGLEGTLEGAGGEGLALEGDETVKLPGPGSYEKTIDAARGMIENDPKRVAQVVKKWIAEDAG